MCGSQSITVECFVEIIFPGEFYCAQITVKRSYDMNVRRNHIAKIELS